MPGARSADLLRLLATGDVQFIVVGMTAGVLQGAPVSTIDVDIVHRRSPENVMRLLKGWAISMPSPATTLEDCVLRNPISLELVISF